jgi:protein tyrosine/serine phosphatase
MFIRGVLIAVVFSGACGGCAHDAAHARVPRPAQWAEPMSIAGVPNLHRVSAMVYRSGQPSAEGMKNLEALGIRTVINLRAGNSDTDEARGTALHLLRTKIYSWHVTDEQVIEVLRALGKSEEGPFLIHCNHGADRTGLMSAMYRILEQDWSREDALAEMIEGGYGFHSIWTNIPRYVRNADPAQLRASID